MEFRAVVDRVETIEFGGDSTKAAFDVCGSDVEDGGFGIWVMAAVNTEGKFGLFGAE